MNFPCKYRRNINFILELDSCIIKFIIKYRDWKCHN